MNRTSRKNSWESSWHKTSILLALTAILPTTAHAADRVWNVASGTEGNFLLGSNWTASFASTWGAADRAIVNNGGTAVISSGSATLTEIWAGNTGSNSGTFKQTGGTVILTDGLVVGRQGTAQGTYLLTGGSITTANLRVGGGAATASGTLTISGSGTSLTSGTSAGFVSVGSPGTGTVSLSDSATWTHSGAGYFAIGSDNSAAGAAGGTGTLTIQTGGKLTIQGATGTGGDLYIGKNSGANGTVTLSGSGSEINLGTGSVILGGTNNGTGGYGTGVLNLNGGTLTANAIVKGTSGTATINFNGGTIKASATNANFFGTSSTANTAAIVSTSLILGTGGLTFDTNGKDVGITQGLTGSGSLTKQGAGTLTLSGANSYTGDTIVNGGALILNATTTIASTSDFRLSSSTLSLENYSGQLATLTLESSSTIDFGNLNSSALAFASSAGTTWNGTLTLLNFTIGQDSLSFTNQNGLTENQLNAISLSGYRATGLDANGAVVFSAVPEPQLAGLLGFGIAASLILRKRR